MKPAMQMKCNVCGKPLDYHCTGDWRHITVEIDPCLTCLRKENTKGYTSGYSEGWEVGRADCIEGWDS
jgi:hypothetical protein